MERNNVDSSSYKHCFIHYPFWKPHKAPNTVEFLEFFEDNKLKLKLLSHFCFKDLLNFSQCSKECYDLVGEKRLWRIIGEESLNLPNLSKKDPRASIYKALKKLKMIENLGVFPKGKKRSDLFERCHFIQNQIEGLDPNSKPQKKLNRLLEETVVHFLDQRQRISKKSLDRSLDEILFLRSLGAELPKKLHPHVNEGFHKGISLYLTNFQFQAIARKKCPEITPILLPILKLKFVDMYLPIKFDYLPTLESMLKLGLRLPYDSYKYVFFDYNYCPTSIKFALDNLHPNQGLIAEGIVSTIKHNDEETAELLLSHFKGSEINIKIRPPKEIPRKEISKEDKKIEKFLDKQGVKVNFVRNASSCRRRYD